KVRVVSMPCWELFDMQSPQYQEKVLPDSVRARVSVEAGSTLGWHKYIGLHDNGTAIGVDTFGESAPIADLWPEFGFTVNNVAAKARQTLKKNRKK
ncbi:MAG: transketolase, partial [Thermodesulfobacteriota bacterium]